jgi:hypothetical protein
MATYIARPLSRPRLETLSPADVRFIEAHFHADSVEMTIDDQIIEYSLINEIEVAVAARQRSPAGCFVKKILYGGDERFHVAVYYAKHHEAVLPNLSKAAAQYVLGNIAFYSRNPIRYKGPEDFIATTES